ncbi:type II secretion system F family protein [Algisphaera agarilytica]|uniref:Tight adherence protein B n=1 Tax=Algisphaera agarilytica TaxID=1385975 RepID=A0A7X0LJ61_9BACT|nr:type II secretion system F family protein [Algisphaera agarilytica]MBB6428266.1 tight adherence protein B [Algisphaera agarilytica]
MFNPPLFILLNLCVFAAAYLLVRYGKEPAVQFRARQELAYDRVLRRQLMMDVEPSQAFWMAVSGVGVAFLFSFFLTFNLFVAVVCGIAAYFMPAIVIRHLEQKRRQQLESQLVDGLTTISAGVKAGLNLVQSMEMLVDNQTGPIKQEFEQLLREYNMGRDLNQAMRAASNRIGSPLYRLTFTAIEMHRVRGGDTGESMDRLADAVREIKKLEGKLDAITAQSRSQASMMAVMPFVFVFILWIIDPEGIRLLFTETIGRVLLLICGALILGAFLWIRKIMAVDV